MMIFVALNEAADCKELLLIEGGMCRFHKRRDGVVVIRELIVLPAARRRGLGRWLVARAMRDHPRSVCRASCPAHYESNGFWEKIGFVKVKEGKVNVWERQPSSTAPTATRRSLELL